MGERCSALQTVCPQGWLCSIATLCFWEVSSPGKWLSCVVTHVLPKTWGSAKSLLAKWDTWKNCGFFSPAAARQDPMGNGDGDWNGDGDEEGREDAAL